MKASYMKPVSIVVATDDAGGIAKNGKMPWPSHHFKNSTIGSTKFDCTTAGGVCIMGRKTYESIAANRKGENSMLQTALLSGRESYVLSRDPNFNPVGAMKGKGLRQVIENLPDNDLREIFVIGGEKLFVEALTWCNKVYVTAIKRKYECDRFFPAKYLMKNYKIDSGEESDNMYFVNYIRL